MDDSIRAGYEKYDRLDRARRIEWLDIKRITKSSALVLGAGALGNEVAKNLVLSGFSSITIVDFDRVERSNLPRCVFFTESDASESADKAAILAKALSSLSIETDISPLICRVEELPREVFREHDIIFGCLDNINARLHANAYSRAEGTPYIDGGMEGTLGRVFISNPPDGPCLECASNATHSEIASLRFSCTGSDVNIFINPVPAEITTTSIISALAVREGLRLLSPNAPRLEGEMIFYDGLRNAIELMEVDVDHSCPNHEKPSDHHSDQ